MEGRAVGMGGIQKLRDGGGIQRGMEGRGGIEGGRKKERQKGKKELL